MIDGVAAYQSPSHQISLDDSKGFTTLDILEFLNSVLANPRSHWDGPNFGGVLGKKYIKKQVCMKSSNIWVLYGVHLGCEFCLPETQVDVGCHLKNSSKPLLFQNSNIHLFLWQLQEYEFLEHHTIKRFMMNNWLDIYDLFAD